jgi:hypothetical protein
MSLPFHCPHCHMHHGDEYEYEYEEDEYDMEEEEEEDEDQYDIFDLVDLDILGCSDWDPDKTCDI